MAAPQIEVRGGGGGGHLPQMPHPGSAIDQSRCLTDSSRSFCTPSHEIVMSGMETLLQFGGVFTDKYKLKFAV